MAKRHHYVPVTYLKQFTDDSGKLLVYRKDEPERPYLQRPEATGFEKYYYSQFAEDGSRDDQKLESVFSDIETPWPMIVKALSERKSDFEAAPHIIVFLALMRVRGPAFRDAVETSLANHVHTAVELEHAAGRLPPLPAGHEDLISRLAVSIDPHQSILMMPAVMKDIGQMLRRLHFDVLHNSTQTPFLTSDNPVIYFDPRRRGSSLRPYHVGREGPIELLFPVTAKMMLRGRTSPQRPGIGHRTVDDRRRIRNLNRIIVRFAYRTVFSSGTGQGEFISALAQNSPVIAFERFDTPTGKVALQTFVFGPRPTKPKWDRSNDDK